MIIHLPVLSDVISLSDVVSRAQGFIKSISEVIMISHTAGLPNDIVSTIKRATRSISEVMSLVDTVVRKGIFTRVVSGTITLIDTLAKGASFTRISSGIITLVDTITKRTDFTRVPTEVIILVDSVAKKIRQSVIIAERIALTDVIAFTRPAVAAVVEEIGGGIRLLKDYYGVLKSWTGKQWQIAQLRIYLNTYWQHKPIYYWDGEQWLEIETE